MKMPAITGIAAPLAAAPIVLGGWRRHSVLVKSRRRRMGTLNVLLISFSRASSASCLPFAAMNDALCCGFSVSLAPVRRVGRQASPAERVLAVQRRTPWPSLLGASPFSRVSCSAAASA